MNKSVNPCDDFYEFACGRWIQTNIIPIGYSAWSTTKELALKNSIILKNILEKTSISSISFTTQQAVKFYQSCMNTSEIERLKIQPLEEFFKNELNFTLKEWINLDKNQTWQGLFISLTKVLSNKYPFLYILPVNIGSDPKNSSWSNMHIDQPILGLGSRDYYIVSPNNSQLNSKNQIIRDTYAKVGSEMFQLLGFEKNVSTQRMNDIIQFETELATVSFPMEILQIPNRTYQLINLKQFQELYQSIGWDVYSFFNDMPYRNTSDPIKFNENDQIIVLSLELIANVSNIITKTLLTPEKSHIVIDAILFALLLRINQYLPVNFGRVTAPLRKQLFGTDLSYERWDYCVKQTDGSFGFELGASYIKNLFGENDRIKATQLIKNIRDMFGENLNSLQWIDQQTKTEAKIKLDKINQKIGYPDFITNQTELNQYYDGYSIVENEYFNNQIKVFSRERRRTLLKFRQKVDKTEWNLTPWAVDAYYSSLSNEIVFPAGVLQSPFFHKDLPLSINYGAIGTLIGHEITHGFDNQGREFDGDGNMRSWWTKLSLENFQEKTKCFIKQYSNYSLDGQRTLGENIADNGGMKLSYLAYQKHRQETSNSNSDLRLPGLDYDNNQLFFIAFAHSWCNIATPNAMQYNIINDPHSLARFRVIGTVRNSGDFSKAFSCKSKTRDKCQLW